MHAPFYDCKIKKNVMVSFSVLITRNLKWTPTHWQHQAYYHCFTRYNFCLVDINNSARLHSTFDHLIDILTQSTALTLQPRSSSSVATWWFPAEQACISDVSPLRPATLKSAPLSRRNLTMWYWPYSHAHMRGVRPRSSRSSKELPPETWQVFHLCGS